MILIKFLNVFFFFRKDLFEKWIKIQIFLFEFEKKTINLFMLSAIVFNF